MDNLYTKRRKLIRRTVKICKFFFLFLVYYCQRFSEESSDSENECDPELIKEIKSYFNSKPVEAESSSHTVIFICGFISLNSG